MLKKAVQQGRSERRGEAYGPHFVGPFALALGLGEQKSPSGTSEFRKTLVEPLSDARTPLADFFSILLERRDEHDERRWNAGESRVMRSNEGQTGERGRWGPFSPEKMTSFRL